MKTPVNLSEPGQCRAPFHPASMPPPHGRLAVYTWMANHRKIRFVFDEIAYSIDADAPAARFDTRAIDQIYDSTTT